MYKTPCLLVVVVVVVVVLGLAIQNASDAYELSGVVQSGLDGKAVAGAGVTLKSTRFKAVTDEAGTFSLTVPDSVKLSLPEGAGNSSVVSRDHVQAPGVRLLADKTGYQQLEYRLYSRTTGLVLSMLPESNPFKASDYTGDARKWILCASRANLAGTYLPKYMGVIAGVWRCGVSQPYCPPFPCGRIQSSP